MDAWDHIQVDREALADYLATLSPTDWDTPSLCDGWTVKGVATHLLVTPTMSKVLRLRATDADWSTGDGPAVEGDAKHLVSAMTGRDAAFDDLSGEGVDIMRSR